MNKFFYKYLVFTVVFVGCREKNPSAADVVSNSSIEIEQASAFFFFLASENVEVTDEALLLANPRSTQVKQPSVKVVSRDVRVENYENRPLEAKDLEVKGFLKNSGESFQKLKKSLSPLNLREKIKESKEKFSEIFKNRKIKVRLVDLYDPDKGGINPTKVFQDPNIQGIKANPKKLDAYLKNLESNGYQVLSYYNGRDTQTKHLESYKKVSQRVENFDRFTSKGETVIFIKPPLFLQGRSSGLGNLRTLPFEGIQITGGMRPLEGQNRVNTETYLNKNYGVVHSLDHRFSVARNAVGESRHTVNLIKDFHPPSIDNMSSLFKDAKASAQSEKNLFVHCGFGGGRTGTMLASLKIFQKFKDLPESGKISFPSEKREKPSKLGTQYQGYASSFKTSKFVKEAVEEIRSLETQQVEGNIKISVETVEQFKTLEGFHNVLVLTKIMKVNNTQPKDLVVELESRVSPDVIRSMGENTRGVDPALYILEQARDVWSDHL